MIYVAIQYHNGCDAIVICINHFSHFDAFSINYLGLKDATSFQLPSLDAQKVQAEDLSELG